MKRIATWTLSQEAEYDTDGDQLDTFVDGNCISAVVEMEKNYYTIHF